MDDTRWPASIVCYNLGSPRWREVGISPLPPFSFVASRAPRPGRAWKSNGRETRQPIFDHPLTVALFCDTIVVGGPYGAFDIAFLKGEESMKDIYERPILVKHEPLRDVTAGETGKIAPN